MIERKVVSQFEVEEREDEFNEDEIFNLPNLSKILGDDRVSDQEKEKGFLLCIQHLVKSRKGLFIDEMKLFPEIVQRLLSFDVPDKVEKLVDLLTKTEFRYSSISEKSRIHIALENSIDSVLEVLKYPKKTRSLNIVSLNLIQNIVDEKDNGEYIAQIFSTSLIEILSLMLLDSENPILLEVKFKILHLFRSLTSTCPSLCGKFLKSKHYIELISIFLDPKNFVVGLTSSQFLEILWNIFKHPDDLLLTYCIRSITEEVEKTIDLIVILLKTRFFIPDGPLSPRDYETKNDLLSILLEIISSEEVRNILKKVFFEKDFFPSLIQEIRLVITKEKKKFTNQSSSAGGLSLEVPICSDVRTNISTRCSSSSSVSSSSISSKNLEKPKNRKPRFSSAEFGTSIKAHEWEGLVLVIFLTSQLFHNFRDCRSRLEHLGFIDDIFNFLDYERPALTSQFSVDETRRLWRVILSVLILYLKKTDISSSSSSNDSFPEFINDDDININININICECENIESLSNKELVEELKSMKFKTEFLRKNVSKIFHFYVILKDQKLIIPSLELISVISEYPQFSSLLGKECFNEMLFLSTDRNQKFTSRILGLQVLGNLIENKKFSDFKNTSSKLFFSHAGVKSMLSMVHPNGRTEFLMDIYNILYWSIHYYRNIEEFLKFDGMEITLRVLERKWNSKNLKLCYFIIGFMQRLIYIFDEKPIVSPNKSRNIEKNKKLKEKKTVSFSETPGESKQGNSRRKNKNMKIMRLRILLSKAVSENKGFVKLMLQIFHVMDYVSVPPQKFSTKTKIFLSNLMKTSLSESKASLFDKKKILARERRLKEEKRRRKSEKYRRYDFRRRIFLIFRNLVINEKQLELDFSEQKILHSLIRPYLTDREYSAWIWMKHELRKSNVIPTDEDQLLIEEYLKKCSKKKFEIEKKNKILQEEMEKDFKLREDEFFCDLKERIRKDTNQMKRFKLPPDVRSKITKRFLYFTYYSKKIEI